MATRQERRRFKRAEIKWPIKIQSALGPIEGELKDISVGGAFIDCEQILDPGDSITVAIFIPDHSPLKIIAEVMWTCMAFPHGMGVQFMKISQEDSEFLAQAISKIPEVKSDEETLFEF